MVSRPLFGDLVGSAEELTAQAGRSARLCAETKGTTKATAAKSCFEKRILLYGLAFKRMTCDAFLTRIAARTEVENEGVEVGEEEKEDRVMLWGGYKEIRLWCIPEFWNARLR